MNLIAIIPAGITSVTVNGLHQWDYGRGLNIVADGLPRLVEVHFSCAGMTEAAVRVAEVTDSTALVTIPDQCLEQTTPVTAWVYLKNDASARTAMEITLPIIPRAQPAAVGTSDDEARAATRYDELFNLTDRVMENYETLDADIQAAIDAGATATDAANEAEASKTSAATSETNAANSASDAAAAADRAESVIPFIDSTYLHHPCGRSPAQTFDFANQDYKIYAPVDYSTQGLVGKKHGTLFLACGYMDNIMAQFLFFWDGISETYVHSPNALTFVAEPIRMLAAQYIHVTPTDEYIEEDGRRYNVGVVKFYQTYPGGGEEQANPGFSEVRIVPLTTWG